MSNIKELVKASREFFNSNETKELSFRVKQLKVLKKAIEDCEEQIAQALKKDLNKPKFTSYATEIGLVIKEIDLFLKRLEAWNKPEKVKTSLMHFWSKSYIYKEPYGVVLIFAPWNYPFQLLLLPLVGAIAAGNTAILKPSEFAPATSAIVKNIIQENFSGEYIEVIEGEVEVSKALLMEKFDYIFFTGSKQVGKYVMKAASGHLTPVTLELGGKSPCIVCKEANVDLAAKRIIWGKYINAGQLCVAPDYLLLHQDIKDEFLIKAREYIRDFFGENPSKSPDYCRIINKNHFNRLLDLMNEGETIIGGGSSCEELYIEPTIIDKIKWSDPIMEEEIFGPILPVIEFNDLKNIINEIKDRPKPLALYIFSENKDIQNKVLKEISFGGGCINDTVIHVSSTYLPFGGVGDSGMGIYHGKSSYETFTHKKSIIKKTTLFDLSIRYPPYKGKLEMVKRFF
ncbi:MAG: aldehyde dehydrogenase, partial [Clostridia bacterium]